MPGANCFNRSLRFASSSCNCVGLSKCFVRKSKISNVVSTSVSSTIGALLNKRSCVCFPSSSKRSPSTPKIFKPSPRGARCVSGRMNDGSLAYRAMTGYVFPGCLAMPCCRCAGRFDETVNVPRTNARDFTCVSTNRAARFSPAGSHVFRGICVGARQSCGQSFA